MINKIKQLFKKAPFTDSEWYFDNKLKRLVNKNQIIKFGKIYMYVEENVPTTQLDPMMLHSCNYLTPVPYNSITKVLYEDNS